MANARYFLPDHPTLTDVYSKSDLRAMLISGKLSRSDMVLDDETGLGHLLGGLLAMPYPDVTNMPSRSTSSAAPRPQLPPNHEFRADTPLPRPESEFRPPSARRSTPEEDLDDHEDHPEDEVTFEEEEEEEEEGFDDNPAAPEDEDDGDHPEDIHDDDGGDDDAFRLNPPSSEAEGGFAREEWRPGQASSGSSNTFSYPRQSEGGASPYPEDHEPEEMLYQGHPSWFAYPRSMLAIALALTGAIVSHRMQFGMEWVMLFSSVAGLILLFMGLERYTCTYFITTRRIETEYGVIGRNTREVRIRDIRAIDVQQQGWRALLGMGNVKFDSSVSSGPEVYFKNVRRPHDIKELVRELQR